jgi:hypothetical protein
MLIGVAVAVLVGLYLALPFRTIDREIEALISQARARRQGGPPERLR